MPSLVGQKEGHESLSHAQDQCFEILNKARSLGSNFWNGGELYGTPGYNSLHLLNRYFFEYPSMAGGVVLTIEQTVAVLAQLVHEGKVRGIGLSQIDAETTLRAVHPNSAVEVELSLFDTRIIRDDVAKVCADLDGPIIAYSPLGRGVLAGACTNASDNPEGDFRRSMPMLQDKAMEQNIPLVNEVIKLASRKGVAPLQIALAWVLSLSGKPRMPTIVPI
ncbi:Pyridoxine 4-dehydrogenase [Aspergillus hancockii]|nr:Pyridoxine 4-dehydrogenase [Aspergillus hancockii]